MPHAQTRKQARKKRRSSFRAHTSSASSSRNFCLISSFVWSERSERCKLALRPPMTLHDWEDNGKKSQNRAVLSFFLLTNR